MTQHFAVVGNPIAHSLSPAIHQQFAAQYHIDLNYSKIKGDELDFEQQINDFFTANGRGLNITLPFKSRAFALAEQHSERCLRAGAANTLWLKSGKLMADNTDGVGLLRDLSQHTAIAQQHILIVGAGGAARGIIQPLLDQNPASLTVANRSNDKMAEFQRDFPQISWCKLNELSCDYDVIINATSATLSQQALLLPQKLIEHSFFCYDLSYQLHEHTPFVAVVHACGGRAIDGLGMLVEQAAEAFWLWHGIRPATTEIINGLRQLR